MLWIDFFFLIKLVYRSALLFIKKRLHFPVPICSISITQWVSCDLFYMSKMKDIGIKNMQSLFKSFAAGIKQAHKVEVNSSTQSKSPKSIVCLNLTLSATQYKQLIWQTFRYLAQINISLRIDSYLIDGYKAAF